MEERILSDRDLCQLIAAGHLNLRGADLDGAMLERANLAGANLQWANVREVCLQGAHLRGANLDGVQLQSATCDVDTVWPDGFDWKAAGVILRED